MNKKSRRKAAYSFIKNGTCRFYLWEGRENARTAFLLSHHAYDTIILLRDLAVILEKNIDKDVLSNKRLLAS